jgi:Rrf2 family protein
MVALALEYGHGPVLLKDIAERQHLPTTYLEQLMVPLRKARIVTATRGVNGGYVLMRDPNTITLADVIQVLEGPLELVDCSAVASCHWNPQQCALKTILTEASQLLTDFFGKITLAELARQQVARLQDGRREPALSYTI